MEINESFRDKFNSQVDDSGDCSIWLGACNTNGIPITWANNALITARRVSWILSGRDLEATEFVRGVCGQMKCVKPSHLKSTLAKGTDLERFLSRLSVRKECWEWTGSIGKGLKNYGRFKVDGGWVFAHRYAWFLATGHAPPNDLMVRHTCDNPPCVRPSHLLLGTHLDNVADKVARGRQPRGVTHPLAKLTEADVIAIRKASAGGESYSALGRQYGVTFHNIRRICLRLTWPHIA